MIYRGLTTLILIAVIVGAALLGQQHFRPRGSAATATRAQEPGYSVRDAELIETGADGRPLYRLNAETIRESPGNGTVELDGVQMSYRGENSNQWALTADRGFILENNEQVELEGDVRVVGVLQGSSELAQILTEKLAYDARSDTASTDEPVTFRWGRGEIHGVGAVARLKERQVSIKSSVHGRFTP